MTLAINEPAHINIAVSVDFGAVAIEFARLHRSGDYRPTWLLLELVGKCRLNYGIVLRSLILECREDHPCH